MEFEWDERKAAANLLRHGVSFDEQEPFSKIRSMLISTIQIILSMSIDISLLGNHSKVVCWSCHTPSGGI